MTGAANNTIGGGLYPSPEPLGGVHVRFFSLAAGGFISPVSVAVAVAVTVLEGAVTTGLELQDKGVVILPRNHLTRCSCCVCNCG